MRFLTMVLLVLLTAASVQASDALLNSLQPRGLVSDYANVISSGEERRLNSILTELQQRTGTQIAVVTLHSLEGGEIDDFTNRLFNRWGVGQKDKDNGVMFLAAIQDRKMRIEVGYGLEDIIPDSAAGRIRRNIITPHFKSGNYGQGILAGTIALSQRIARHAGVRLSTAPATRSAREIILKIGGLLILIGIPGILFCAGIPKKKGGVSVGGHYYGGYGASGGFGGGCGGRGGGGFGGGMSGGGGSSGGW